MSEGRAGELDAGGGGVGKTFNGGGKGCSERFEFTS